MSGVMEMWRVTFWRVKNLSITIAFHMSPLHTTVLTCPIINETSIYLLFHLKPPKTRTQIFPGGMIIINDQLVWALQNARRISHQENSNHLAGLEPDTPDASTLSESEWRHNTLPMP